MPDIRTPPAGLCGTCLYSKTIESAKGSTFHLCQRGLKDPRFPKYPRLPVISCEGWMSIRAARVEDLDSIQRIYAHWVLSGVASFEIDAPSVDELRRRFGEIQSRSLPYLVAQTGDGRVAGYAYATLYRPRPAYRFTVEDSIYIDPEFAGQGLGRPLLEAIIAETSKQGYKQMIAVIGGGMENAASVALHSRCGFEHAGILKSVGFKFDRWLDTVLMQRSL